MSELSVLKIVLPMLCTSLHCQNQREGLVLESSNGTQHPWQNNLWNDERCWFWGTLHQSFTTCDFCYPIVSCRGRWTADNDENRPLQHWRCTCHKRTSDKLAQLTSDVFNSGKQNVTPAITEAKPEPAPESKASSSWRKGKCDGPTFQITGGTIITMNINSNSSDWQPCVFLCCTLAGNASTTSNSANVKLWTTAAMVDNPAKMVDECPLNRGRYCLRTIGTAKTVHYAK